VTAADVSVLVGSAAELGTRIGPEAVSRISRFLELLLEWNRRFSLTGEQDPSRLVRLHVVDSIAPVSWLPGAGLVVDVGSGGGFPGIILGCVRPDLDLILIESRRRPVSFLREAIRTVPLPQASALEMRAEEAARDPRISERAAVVVGRAIRLPVFLQLAAGLVSPDGSVIAMQTPRSAGRLDENLAGLRLVERRPYRLPGGAARVLLRFVRRPVS
jgi:16S rRNA (guanine527-N7)-methyltransferase